MEIIDLSGESIQCAHLFCEARHVRLDPRTHLAADDDICIEQHVDVTHKNGQILEVLLKNRLRVGVARRKRLEEIIYIVKIF